jgi:hypothetical protein
VSARTINAIERRASVAINWDRIRSNKFAPEPPPANWPTNVRPISIEGCALFGVEPDTNKLYWDGKEIVLRDRVRFDWPERLFGFMVAVGTFGYFFMELGKLLRWWGA